MGSWTYNVAARFFRISKVNVLICAQFYSEMCPWWSIFVLVIIGTEKYRTSRRLRPFNAHFQTKADMAWHITPQGIIYMSKLRNTQEMKYVWRTIKFNYFVIPASVWVIYVAIQFHVCNNDGRMSKGVKTSQRCEWLIVTSRNISSKINVKPSKVQIPVSFLIIQIFWSNKNEFTRQIINCLKTTESQNGQIYPEDTFSHGAAHILHVWQENTMIYQTNKIGNFVFA